MPQLHIASSKLFFYFLYCSWIFFPSILPSGIENESKDGKQAKTESNNLITRSQEMLQRDGEKREQKKSSQFHLSQIHFVLLLRVLRNWASRVRFNSNISNSFFCYVSMFAFMFIWNEINTNQKLVKLKCSVRVYVCVFVCSKLIKQFLSKIYARRY